MQSKDMAPRFSKKGKLNADEVRSLIVMGKDLFLNSIVHENGPLLHKISEKEM